MVRPIENLIGFDVETLDRNDRFQSLLYSLLTHKEFDFETLNYNYQETILMAIDCIENGESLHKGHYSVITRLCENVERDKRAKEIGMIVVVSGEFFFCSLTNNMNLYIGRNDSGWELWRESYYHIGRKVRIIGRNYDFNDVLYRAESYLAWWMDSDGNRRIHELRRKKLNLP